MNNHVFSKQFELDRIDDLKGRVSEKRLTHILGVADTCEKLAELYGVDCACARLAGLLHDWDKGYSNKEIRRRVQELNLESKIDPWLVINMPQVLHGPTAAAALARDFPEIPSEIIKAIQVHTTACVDMSDIDKVLYIADAIEPSRKFERAEKFRKQIGKLSLDELYYSVYKFWTLALMEHDVVLHPDTISIYNSLAEKKQKDK